MTLVLEIRWSAPGTTVVVVDTATHSTVGEGHAEHPGAGASEQDAAGWWDAAGRAARLALDGLAALGLTAEEIALVSVAEGAPPGGLVALDDTGMPVRDGLLGDHEGSAPDADWLIGHAEGGADGWRAATDLLPTAGSTVALLSWLHRSDGAAWDRATRFTTPAGWLLEQLGADEPSVGPRDAVGTAVLDRRSGERWCTDLLAVVDDGRDWERALPRIVPAATPVGVLSTGAADVLGTRAGLPLHTGTSIPGDAPGS